MQFDIVYTPEPEPMPTVTQLPDLGPAADLSASIAGIVTLVILALGALAWRRLGAVFAEMSTDVKATKEDAKEAKAQTTNSHETNLRDDLTLAIQKIDEVAKTQGAMAAQQSAMHEDLRDTRRDVRFNIEYTRDVDKRLGQHLDTNRGYKEEGTHG